MGDDGVSNDGGNDERPSPTAAISKSTPVPAPNYESPSDKLQNAERRAANWTAGATVAIAVFTAATIGLGIAQWNVLSTTVSEMKDEQRPWIRIDSVAVKDVRIDGEDITADVTYNISNVGHKPAVAIFAINEIYGIMPPVKLLSENPAMNLCLWSDAGGLASLNISKFINDISAISFPEGKGMIAGSIRGKVDLTPKLAMQGDRQLILVSCISYNEPASRTTRHTAISTMVSIQGPGKDGAIPDDRIKIDRPDFGWFNYAD